MISVLNAANLNTLAAQCLQMIGLHFCKIGQSSILKEAQSCGCSDLKSVSLLTFFDSDDIKQTDWG